MSSSLSHRQHLANLVDQLSTSVILLDADLHIQNLNQAAQNLLLVSSQQARGIPLEQIVQLEAELLGQFKASLRQGQSFTSREVKIKLAGHPAMVIDLTGTPLDDQQSLVLEIQPLDRFSRLSRGERMHSRRQSSANLVRNLAHEIKNPLGGIRGAAQLLERELENQIDNTQARLELQEYTHVIISEANRLRDLVDRLLGPQRQAHKQHTNIHQVLDKTYKLLAAEAGEEVDLIKDYDPSLPELMLDANQLMQVFLNIGRNALQAVQENNIQAPSIRFQTRAVRRFTIGNHNHRLVCRIRICDNGPGINPELKDEIFFPMVTHRAQGTGLGLSIAQNLVAQHQGLIECDSKPGKTCFNIYIPMERP
ncbi:MAG: nitrogen regulation protein NR(II) [Gammaproteobacteria bacterium]|jgi:two-component system nitrogen regulation sensor histidine kinase GlnL|nr:nitrogen regulation protein NR(II) [Gammaproteobacteria bacterium]MCP4879968.1 nitrogen regulation protein NR(II) [Gammaproteobacteria bacterium]MDP6164599.1 nitrogen regulation protein NR(II) [Gammaproteobacteria bacterium]